MAVFTPTICVFATRCEDAAPTTTMASYDGIIGYQRPQGVGRGLGFFPPRGFYPPFTSASCLCALVAITTLNKLFAVVNKYFAVSE